MVSFLVVFRELAIVRKPLLINKDGIFGSDKRFRAGCEGSISVLKRVFNLGRCLFKGFKNYAARVGCAVFCHNLILLTRL